MSHQNQNFLNGVNIPISASMVYIEPGEITSDSFITPEDEAIIPNQNLTSSFFPSENLVEFYVYDTQKNIISRNYNFTDWVISNNTSNTSVPTTYTNDQGIEVLVTSSNPIPTDNITLNPPNDLHNLGFDTGEVYALYNFINYELSSSIDNTYYIAEISGDRTEVRLKSNTISNGDIRGAYQTFRQQFNSSEYFDEFYLGLFDNRYEICTNIFLEEDERGSSILLKLYNELDPSITTESQVYVVTKVGETVSYKVEFQDDFTSFIDNANYIKGPNINIPLQDLINNSTTLLSKEDLLNSPSTGSTDRVLNILNQTGVTITPNYSYNTFNQFVNFSSAKERINNFVEKVSQIQSYESDITIIENVTGSNPSVTPISSSLASLTTKITNLIENFDGYENYLYYTSSSFSYPKTGSAYPYSLLPTTDAEVLTWVGNDVEGSQYYGGYVLSASLYDGNNQNWLYYTIPPFITENSNNNEYVTFSNMVGQSFDEVWIYTKALSERYNTTNNPDKGLPLDLAADAIKGLGFETFGNNYDNQDNFIGLAGEDNGVYVPPTGSELITKYIAINNGEIINYWHVGYSWADYVEQFTDAGFPYAIDKVSKEIYKRLYHNMAYLTKKKGSISGLRQLINIWGIPNTILRINEFGGKNRDNTDDYDLWQNRYSYTYTPVAANNYFASSSVKIPWMPLERNYISDSEYVVPDGVALRFKASKGSPTSIYGGSFYSQSIAVKKSNGLKDDKMDWGISLYYEDQPSGSYSGSSHSNYYNYGKLRLHMSASTADGGVQTSSDIYLPFFDGGWWSVLLQRDQHSQIGVNNVPTTYTLFAANKQDNGWDGNSIGFTGSVSLDSTSKLSLNKSWNDYGVTEEDGVYVGGYVSGSNIMSKVSNNFGKILSGSFQEFRYYSNDIKETVFNDFVMNPESIEGNNITGSESSFDIVNFRAPLGNELEHIFSGSTATFVNQISSSHPAVTGSSTLVITGSFINHLTSGVTSSYDFIGYNDSKDKIYSKTNTEVYFLDQPAIGIRNRISNKIQVEDGNNYGKVLSKYRSIDQNYLISKSYTEDITSLEVGFSPQDEVNDDIIATFGYGAISSIIADPRFFYDSKEVYYPKLKQVSEDYFKKYTEGNVWDYLRLIKYFDNSLFKAIKSYVPARTSVTTGVIIKQNMLERNRVPSVTLNPNTIIAYTPETGSIVGSNLFQTGMNSAISYRNIEITGSIEIGTLNGGTGGVVEPLNTLITQTAKFSYFRNSSTIYTSSPQNIFYSTTTNTPGFLEFDGNITESQGYDNVAGAEKRGVSLSQPLKTRFYFRSPTTPTYANPSDTLSLIISSSIRGGLGKEAITKSKLDFNKSWVTNYYKISPEEEITFSLKTKSGNITIPDFYFGIKTPEDFKYTSPFSSSLHNQYTSQSYIVRNNTVLGSTYTLQDTQDEFYNGEYSGSTIIVTTQSLLDNPYSHASILDTSYNIAITASTGQFNPKVGIISTYPSYSMALEVKAYQNTDSGNNELLSDFSLWKSYHDSTTTGSLYLLSDSDNSNKFWVKALVLPSLMDRSLGSQVFDAEAGRQLGLQGEANNFLISPLIDIPHPSTNPANVSVGDGGIYSPNNLGPYFTLGISGSLDPFWSDPSTSPFTGQGLVMNIGDPDYASKKYSDIFSIVLGSRDIITKASNQLTTATDYNDGAVSYWYNDPSNNGARPIEIFEGTSKQEALVSYADWDANGAPFNQTVTGSTGLGPTTVEIFISNYDQEYQYILERYNSDTYQNNLPTVGSGSLNLIGSTWNAKYSNYGDWSPLILTLNRRNYSTAGTLINNSDTLINTPQFTIDIDQYTGTPVDADQAANILSGLVFDQSRNLIDGVLTFESGTIASPNLNDSIAYAYTPSQSRQISGSLSPQYNPSGIQSSQFIPFDPQLPNQTQFYNSPFNPLQNNVSKSVDNTFLQVVEYDDGPIPSNFDHIVSRTAPKAEVPDSFYTQKASILPRYVGSTLQSADYNVYTSASSIIPLNAISGSSNNSISWGGDNSYGNTSVINSNPTSFAHFKSSYNNQQLAGTATFNIDALILSPQDNIQGGNAPETPVVIKVDGSNESLTEVRSTFEINRKVQVARRNPRFGGVDYTKTTKLNDSNVLIGEENIFQGALEMQTIGASTTGIYGTGSNKFPSFTFTCSLDKADWFSWQTGSAGVGGTYADNINITPTSSYDLTTPTKRAEFGWMATGSNCLYLQGEQIQVSQSVFYGASAGLTVAWSGPALAMINTINTNVYFQKKNYFTTTTPGEPTAGSIYYPGIPISASDDASTNTPNDVPSNYCYQNYGDTNLYGFKESLAPLPFMLLQGDEIECTYNRSSKVGGYAISLASWNTVTFIVRSTTSEINDSISGVYNDTDAKITDSAGSVKSNSIDGQNFFNKVIVYPNPQNYNIVDGQIQGFIIRRRVNNDSKIIIYSTPPIGAESAATGSGEGFLIPVDFTPQQKRNALTLINQLTAKNAFKEDSDSKLTE